MSLLIAMVAQLLHAGLVLAAAPLLDGLARRAAARLAGRAGPPLAQPWRDLWRLARKQTVFSDTASGLFELAPALAFAATLLAACLVPSFALGMAGAPAADLLVIAGLLTLARATLALAAIESGTAQAGTGASRAMAVGVFTEPALLLVVLPIALLAGTTNLDAIASVLREGTLGIRVPLVLAVAALLVVAASRAGEATEAALGREYSGRHLALLDWTAGLRRLLWLGLLADIAVPFGLADATGSPAWWLAGAVVWAGKLAVLTLALALWDAAVSARPARLAETLGLALLLGLLAALFLFAGQGLA